MGQEAICTVRHEGKSISGKALLETNELIVRGELPLKIPFSAITSLKAVDGELHVRTKSGMTVFVLGAKAEKWRERIANPKSLIEAGTESGGNGFRGGKFFRCVSAGVEASGCFGGEGQGAVGYEVDFCGCGG